MAPNFSLQNINLQPLQGVSIAQAWLNGQIGDNSTMNSVFGALGDVEGMVNGNSQQQGQYFYSLLQRGIDMLMSALKNNEASEASKNSAENNKKSTDINNKAKLTKKEIQEGIEKNKTIVDNEKSRIEKQTETIEEANKELQEKQKAVEEILKQIEEKQKTAKSATTKSEQEAAINDLNSLAFSLVDVIKSTTSIKEKVESASKEVESSVKTIEETNAGVFKLQEEKSSELAQIASDASNQAQENQSEVSKAPQNKATAVALREKAAMSTSGPQALITGTTLAPKLIAAANDQDAAAVTRETSGVQNLNILYEGIGNLSKGGALLQEFSTVLGGAFNDYVGCIGSWNNSLSPMITAFGSIETCQGSADELAAATIEDQNTIASQTQGTWQYNLNKTLSQNTTSEPAADISNNKKQQNANLSSEDSADKKVEGLKSPDIKIEKPSFGL